MTSLFCGFFTNCVQKKQRSPSSYSDDKENRLIKQLDACSDLSFEDGHASSRREGESSARDIAPMRTALLPSSGGPAADPKPPDSDAGRGGEAAGKTTERHRFPQGGQTPARGESFGTESAEHGEEPFGTEPAQHRGTYQVAEQTQGLFWLP